jgi:hypothetical protein
MTNRRELRLGAVARSVAIAPMSGGTLRVRHRRRAEGSPGRQRSNLA